MIVTEPALVLDEDTTKNLGGVSTQTRFTTTPPSTPHWFPKVLRQTATICKPGRSFDLTVTPSISRKQFIKAIRYIRDDLVSTSRGLKLPSGWMVRCLVESAFRSGYRIPKQNGNTTTDQLIALLHHILHRCSLAYTIQNCFHDTDGKTPLFPNRELFGPQHVRRFAKAALAHLDAL